VAVLTAPAGGQTMSVRPMRTLGLLSVAHAFNHAQAALLPFVFLVIIDQFGVSVADLAFLIAVTTLVAGSAQLTYSWLTRRFSRAAILGWGNVVFGAFTALAALTSSIVPFAAALIASKVGGSPQHPVGNALLAEQFPPHRRGFAISSHIAGGNIGTVGVPLVAAWLIAGVGWGPTMVLFGIPAALVGLAIVRFVRESGADRAAALAQGDLRSAFGTVLRDRDLLLVFLSSMLGGGARGLGMLNLFVPLYLALVIGLPTGTVALMLTVLLLGSVPGPILAGWLSDRVGRKPLIVAVYIGGAASLALFVLAGSDEPLIWLAIVLMSIFSFVESPQLQSLLADISRPGIRDASFALYFTLAFGIGAVWTALYGTIIAGLGDSTGLPVVFGVMACAYLLAAAVVMPIRAEQRARAVREEEQAAALGAGAVVARDGVRFRGEEA
jgi:MFS family permease